MIIFYVITVIVFIVLGLLFWRIWTDPENGNQANIPKNDRDTITAAHLLNRIGLEKNSINAPPKNTIASLLSMMSRSKKTTDSVRANAQAPSKEQLTENTSAPHSGTAALRLDSSNPLPSSIETDVELSIKNDALQKENQILNEKYKKIELLLEEKIKELEKNQKELDSEKKHRKEFNKVKDLLEKEIKEAKENTKRAESDWQSAKAERLTGNNRILQLEEKIKLIEKESNAKDGLLKELQEKISLLESQQSSTSTPNLADVPPSHNDDTTAQSAESTTATTNNQTPEPPPPVHSESESAATTMPPPSDDIHVSNLTPISNLENNYETVSATHPNKEEAPPVQNTTDNTETDAGNDPQPQQPSTKTKDVPDPLISDQNEGLSAAEPIPVNENGGNSPENTNQIDDQRPPADGIEDKHPGDQNPVKKADATHLPPDIFQDIEEQFRKIESEMNITKENQNIETEDSPEKEAGEDA